VDFLGICDCPRDFCDKVYRLAVLKSRNAVILRLIDILTSSAELRFSTALQYAIIPPKVRINMARARHKARTIALQALYEIDSAARPAETVVERLLAGNKLSEQNVAFVRELVAGVVRHRDKIDDNIQQFAPAWPLEQLAMIDRNILRLAIFEILFDNKVPVKVAVSEAVELAKTFGSESSPKFVNGVLGSVSALAGR
jgi:N utilization substance protein B